MLRWLSQVALSWRRPTISRTSHNRSKAAILYIISLLSETRSCYESYLQCLQSDLISPRSCANGKRRRILTLQRSHSRITTPSLSFRLLISEHLPVFIKCFGIASHLCTSSSLVSTNVFANFTISNHRQSTLHHGFLRILQVQVPKGTFQSGVRWYWYLCI